MSSFSVPNLAVLRRGSDKENVSMTESDARLPTGLPGLDAVLGGGLNRPSLVAIVGAPGAGKTILASQIMFHAARQGLQTLVLTAFSEGNDQYTAHLRTLEFFEPALLGDKVQLFTLQSQFTAEDTAPGGTIVHTVRSMKAKVVLIDGFQGVAPLLPPGQSIRALLAALAVQLRYLDATLLLTLAGDARDLQLGAELTVADVIIGLVYTIQGRRHQRLLEVVKQRGRALLAGLHSYTLDGRGMRVFPRIEVYPQPESRPHPAGRAPFGLPELDQMLGGGLTNGTTTLLAGAPGVGKTTLGLHWALTTAEPGATSLFLTFGEYAEQLEHKAAAFGLDLHDALARGVVRVVRIAAVDLDPDQVAAIVLNELASGAVRRLVIDDIAVLLHELGERAHSFLSALNNILYGVDITSLYLLEIPAFEGLRVNFGNTPLAALGDNVVVIQQYEINGALRRLLAVLRMRLSFFDRTVRELILDEQGVRVLQPEEQVLAALKDGAQPSGGIVPDGMRRPSKSTPGH
jgi:circadian clock protein KaiC